MLRVLDEAPKYWITNCMLVRTCSWFYLLQRLTNIRSTAKRKIWFECNNVKFFISFHLSFFLSACLFFSSSKRYNSRFCQLSFSCILSKNLIAEITHAFPSDWISVLRFAFLLQYTLNKSDILTFSSFFSFILNDTLNERLMLMNDSIKRSADLR